MVKDVIEFGQWTVHINKASFELYLKRNTKIGGISSWREIRAQQKTLKLFFFNLCFLFNLIATQVYMLREEMDEEG